jgi:hypothetical protein
MLRYRNAAVLGTVVLFLHGPPAAKASCGQAFCSVDPRLAENATLGARTMRLGFETEYIEQDQPWVSFHSAGVGEIPRPDHNEVETTNLTWKWTAEAGLTDSWSFGLMVPLLHREHLHLAVPDHDDSAFGRHAGGADESEHEDDTQTVTIGDATGVPERWSFTRLGDLQLTVAHRVLGAAEGARTALTLYAGLKVPTGETGVRNSEGEAAEITLQPGTGSVDPIFGARLQHQFSIGSERLLPVSLGVHVRTEGSDGRFGYRPGTEMIISAGSRYPLFERLQPVLQLNFRYRDRDHVGDAPGVPKEHTGGETLYVTPGFWVVLVDRLDAQVLVQAPALQRVNGIQLVSDWNLWLGLSYRLNLW